MSANDSAVVLLQRLKAGDADAAEVVFRRYIHRLAALARRHLFARARPVVDSEDVALSALNSFLVRPEASHDLEDAESLWRYLAAITLYKCRKWNRHFSTQKRGGDTRQVPWPSPSNDSDLTWEPVDVALTPADGAVMAETIEKLLADLEPNARTMCQLRLEGYQVQEIAARMNYTEEWVCRKLRLVKDRLLALLERESI